MQKAEPQHGQIQQQPALKQAKAASVESPQGEHIAQLEAVMDSSPRQVAQKKLFDSIHNSPHQTAQRKKFDSLFGTAQRVGEEEPLQGKFASDSPAQLKQQPAAKPINIPVSGAASGMPIQKVSKVYVGTDEVKITDQEGPKVFNALNTLTKNFAGEVWFNSGPEMVQWVTGKNREGIGIWNGKWMNFSNKGPIVFGEEHNEIRHDFITKLNIVHFLVEGASERSLAGVKDADIPQHSKDPVSNSKYTGDANGKALENYWLRSAQWMARFGGEFENELKVCDPSNPWITQIERLDELQELMTTVAGIKLSEGKTGVAKQINDEIGTAQFYAGKAIDCGINDLFTAMKKEYRAYMYSLPETIKKVNARGQGLHYLYVCFSSFRKSIENIGYLNFKAGASEEELAADEETKNSKDPFKVWGGRREHFMLKNLEAALGQTPPPLITTMGSAHANNQKDKIETLLSKYGGMLVIGTIADLADIGAAKLSAISEGISGELAQMYGWSEKSRKTYASSKEAQDAAKIRLGNTKKPTPSYIG